MVFKLPSRQKKRKTSSTAFSNAARTRRGSESRSSKVLSKLRKSSNTRSTDPPSSRTTPSVSNASQTVHSQIPQQTANIFSEPEALNEEDLDSLNEIVMAVDLRDRNSVGCCYYVAQQETLYFMEDVKLGGVEIVELLKLYINPTVALISTRVEESVYEMMNLDVVNPAYSLENRPASDFNYEAAKSKLVNLEIGSRNGPQLTFIVPGDSVARDGYDDCEDTIGQKGLLMRLYGWIDLESRITVSCAGAVLSYLQRRRAARFLPGDDAARSLFRISTIEMFTLRGNMFINKDTLLSLQIIHSESHPHSHNQGPTKSSSGSKEGLSIYGLFHHLARTPQGKHLLRQYFLRPSQDIDIIRKRHDSITGFLRPDNAESVKSLIKALKGIVNIKKQMVSLRRGVSGGSGKAGNIAINIWSSLQRFAYNSIGIQKHFRELSGTASLEIQSKILTLFDCNRLAHVGTWISEIVEFEQSAEQHRTVVRPAYDEDLDEIKRFYAGMDDLLGQVAREIANDMPPDILGDLNVIFFPQIGFLITMAMDPMTCRSPWEGLEEDSWERAFSSEQNVYYKSRQMIEMDEHFGDIYAKICDREIEIVHELAQRILEYEDLLGNVSDVCAELDVLLALAEGARLYHLNRPQISTEDVIRIKGGRHLLHELTVPSFVSNDCILGSEAGITADRPQLERKDQVNVQLEVPESEVIKNSNVMILTGPNFSGKSVYLKQIALIVYMAHVGSFVPADQALIGLTDKILTRVQTRESVSNMQSSFMMDLQQITLALNLATNKSLVIIDEFGKGTNDNDGIGLACGVFEYLLSLGPERAPKVIAATHYHEIFENGLLKAGSSLNLKHMEVQIDEQASEAENQIVYLYNLRDGLSIASYGICCAAMNGITSDIVKRAEQLIQISLKGESLIDACGEMSESDMAELGHAEMVARAFLAADFTSDARSMLAGVLDDCAISTSSKL